MLTPKENYLRLLNHETCEYIPHQLVDSAMVGFGVTNGPWFEKGPQNGGYDGFGVMWEPAPFVSSGPIPKQEFILEHITDWKKIKFPDLNDFDWEGVSKAELASIDRNQVLVEYGCGNGIYERLAALMGFENALISLAMEPEACDDFFKALTDYKIDFATQVKKYYNPDIFNNYDDIATEAGLFMSPSCYRELLKPHHKRLYEAVKDMGMFVTQHTCGKAEALVEDFIEIGVDTWSSVQPSNDISTLIQKYGNKMNFAGGFNTNGPAAMAGADNEILINEIHRCFDTYGKYNKGYVFFGFLMNPDLNEFMEKMDVMMGESLSYRMQDSVRPSIDIQE